MVVAAFMVATLTLISQPFATPTVTYTNTENTTHHSSGDEAKGGGPVYILNFDEIPLSSLVDENGKINANRFPNFARFADTSTHYANYTTTIARTIYAVPSLLSGVEATEDLRHPIPKGWKPTPGMTRTQLFANLHAQTGAFGGPGLCKSDYSKWVFHPGNNPDTATTFARPSNDPCRATRPYDDNLFTRAAEAGYTIHANEWESLQICPDHICKRRVPNPSYPGDPIAVEHWRAQNHLHNKGVTYAQDAAGQPGISQWEKRGMPRKTLHYIHTIFPHSPWVTEPDGTRYGHNSEYAVHPNWSGNTELHNKYRFGQLEEGSPEEAEAMRQTWVGESFRVRHLWQLGAADKYLGEWLDAIESTGNFDDATIVVVADHGQSFAPGENTRDMFSTNQTDLAWTVLMIKEPGQTTGQIDGHHHTAADVRDLVTAAMGDPQGRTGGTHRTTALPGFVAGRAIDTNLVTFNKTAIDPTLHPATIPTDGATTTDAPGWDGLVVDTLTKHVPDDHRDAITELWGATPDPNIATRGNFAVDRLADLRSAKRGECGWDLMVEGQVSPPPGTRYVAVGSAGQIVAVGTIDTVDLRSYNGPLRHNNVYAVAERELLAGRWGRIQAWAVAEDGTILAELSVTEGGDGIGTAHATRRCPSPWPDLGRSDSDWGRAAMWAAREEIIRPNGHGRFEHTIPFNRASLAWAIWVAAGRPIAPPETEPFVDIDPSMQSYEAMRWMRHTGISTGWDDGTYRPFDLVSRQAFAAMLHRAAGNPEVPHNTRGFKDVHGAHPFRDGIHWMGHTGLSTGWDDGTYRPGANITRHAATMMLWRHIENGHGWTSASVMGRT